jgi:hypothetical protein
MSKKNNEKDLKVYLALKKQVMDKVMLENPIALFEGNIKQYDIFLKRVWAEYRKRNNLREMGR